MRTTSKSRLRRRPRPACARAIVGSVAPWVLGLLGTTASVAVAAPPSDDGTQAPKMGTVRTLDDALSLEPGATCLERATLLADVASWRDEIEVDQRVSIRVHGSSEDPRALDFIVWIRDEIAVERSFDPAPHDCADLHAVVALAIAITLDDTLAEALGLIVEVEVEAQAVPQARPGEGDLPTTEDDPPPPRRRGPPLGLTLAAGAFGGLTPGLSGGAELSFDIRPLDHFDLRLGALATHLPGLALDDGEGEVGVTVAAGRLDLCWGTTPAKLRLRICGGVAAGATVAVGRGFTKNFQRATPWLAGIAALDLAIHVIGPLALELRVEGVFPFQQTTLEIRSTGDQALASETFPVAGMIVAVGPRFEF